MNDNNNEIAIISSLGPRELREFQIKISNDNLNIWQSLPEIRNRNKTTLNNEAAAVPKNKIKESGRAKRNTSIHSVSLLDKAPPSLCVAVPENKIPGKRKREDKDLSSHTTLLRRNSVTSGSICDQHCKQRLG
jgi:hypothetical protein